MCPCPSLTSWRSRRWTTSMYSSFASFWNGTPNNWKLILCELEWSYVSGTTTASNTLIWRRRDPKTRFLWKMYIVFGFLSLSLTTPRRTRPPRWNWTYGCLKCKCSGHWGHRTDNYQRGRLCREHWWQRGRDQHLRGPVQQDHFWTSLHEDLQVHISTAALSLWYPGD